MNEIGNVAEVVNAVATTVGSLAVVITAVFGLSQIRQLVKARHLDATVEISREWRNLASERHFVLNELRNVEAMRLKQFSNIPPDIEQKIVKLYGFFESLGVLIDHGIIEKDILFDLIGWSCVRSWEYSKPLLLHWRDERSKHLYENFQLLANMCQRWLEEHDPKWEEMDERLSEHGFTRRRVPGI
jgi:hypothetical protein